jgi:CP family cyanate transporter-like MFS transporter
MAAFAPASPFIRRRVGSRSAVVLALVLIVLGTAARSVGGTGLLFIATVVAGAGIGLAQTVVPASIRERLQGREVMAIGGLAAAISGGAIAASALSEPIARGFGSWRPALAVWALPALCVIPLWLIAAPKSLRPRATPELCANRNFRYAAMGLLVGAVSYAYFVVFAWLVPALIASGLRAETAGVVLAAVSAVQIPAALATGAVVHAGTRATSVFPRWLTVTALGLIGLSLAPPPLAIPFALVTGVGLGAMFALSLMLPVQSARDPDEAVWLAGRTFAIGYVIASAGPVLTGLARDLTGSLTPGLIATAVLLMIATSLARSLEPTTSIGTYDI